MHNLVAAIARANEQELQMLLDAVLQRYSVLLPDREVCTISLDKGSDRNEQLDRMINALQNCKTSP